jgi:hypothetical protein
MLLWIWKRLWTLPTKMFLNKFNSTWRIKSLIVTRSNLVVTWIVRSQMSIISWYPLKLHWFHGECTKS